MPSDESAQTLTVMTELPLAIRFLSGRKLTFKTGFVGPPQVSVS